MGMSDCEKCWNTPCVCGDDYENYDCGHNYENYDLAYLIKMRDMFDDLIKRKQKTQTSNNFFKFFKRKE